MLFSPFEQFEINIVLPLVSAFGDISITNSTFFTFFIAGSILFFLQLAVFQLQLVPFSKLQYIFELIFSFILSLLYEQVNNKHSRLFFSSLFSLFLFILFSNLSGLTPWGFTVTGHIIVTFTLAFSFFLSLVILGFYFNQLKFFRIFLPSGIPVWLRPLLVIIEILSFSLRPLSLSIRLFANMLAGHILLNIISGAVLFIASSSFLLALLPFSFVVAFMLLEIGIAFLQAYVFTILICIYLHDAYNTNH
jgi:F-type H+-transporting ATPase subunit a